MKKINKVRIARCVMICGAAIGICTMLGDEFADGYSQGYKKGYKAGSGDEAMSILKDLALCGKTIFKDPDTGSKREFKVTE